MNDELLPIQFFAKRDVDILKVEAGGGGEQPKFVQSPEALRSKSMKFVAAAEDFRIRVLKKEKENSLIPVVFKASIIDDAVAKTHRREIRSLFKTGAQNNLLGLAEEDELLIKVESTEDIDKIIERLKDTERYAYALSALERIAEFRPAIYESKSMKPVDYKLKLIDFQNYEQNKAIRNYFEKAIAELGFELKKTNYSPSHVVYKIENVDHDSLKTICENEIIEAVFSIEPMPKYRVSLDSGEEKDSIQIILPQEGKKYATVGVLDSGIADIPHLKPWLLATSYSPYPEFYMKKDHGTFVAGIVYGDRLEGENWVGIDGVKLFDACVFPDTEKESIDEDELVSNIQEAVRAHHNEVKIWNLSISVCDEVDEYKFSDFAVALDALQEEYGILICKSAGNCDNFTKGHPKGKIHQGADSVRAIVVGSIAHKKSPTDLADVDNPSPFTRIGRGPSHIIKPEVVHYGGNAGIDKFGNCKATGVKSFGINGDIALAAGTSFSTSRVAALAAGLYQEMAEEFDPLLIKALIIHSAKYPEKLDLPLSERINQVGFGIPRSINEILYNSPNEITLILRDEIVKGEYIDIMEFPMPDCLIDDNYYTGNIVVTLVYNPILDLTQSAEYCQSNIDIKMGTYDKKKERDITKYNVLNQFSRDGSHNILLENCYSKLKMSKNNSAFALQERLLIKYGDKYYPVKKYAVDLAEMTENNKRKYLTKDKKWYLSIKGLYRDHIEQKSQIDGTVLRQEFCLIVTIKDPAGTKPVYNEVNQKLNEYNFWHSNIRLHSEIEVRN